MLAQMGWWDWLGIALGGIGVVAFIMAVQPFIQMFAGKPRLDFDFAETFRSGRRCLFVFVSNPPISNKWAIKMGLHRMNLPELGLMIAIKNQKTGEMFESEASFHQLGDEDRLSRITLEPSVFPATFDIVVQDESPQQAIIITDPKNVKTIAMGTYTLKILALGTMVKRTQRDFLVGEAFNDLKWL